MTAADRCPSPSRTQTQPTAVVKRKNGRGQRQHQQQNGLKKQHSRGEQQQQREQTTATTSSSSSSSLSTDDEGDGNGYNSSSIDNKQRLDDDDEINIHGKKCDYKGDDCGEREMMSSTNYDGEKQQAEEMAKRSYKNLTKCQLRLALPSTYVKMLLPHRLYKLFCYGSYLFWFTIGVLVLRKTRSATSAIRYVKTHGSSVSLSSIENSAEFAKLLSQMEADDRPPAILMLNQYALNMTFNFLCNTAIFPGVHQRFIFVTLDSTARSALAEHWPNVKQFYWPTPCLFKPFSFAEGPYQTIYLLRSNLAVALIKRGRSFWMMQQDTFWRQNLFDSGLEDEPGFDLLFDQIGHGNNSKRAEWVNGANFFVRANNDTQLFFEAVAAKLAHWYTPDMGIMIHQCHTWGGKPKCNFIPHRIAHSWEWMYTNQREPPHILQLDCETDGGGKLKQLARFGFNFTMADGRTCNPKAVREAQTVMERGLIDVGGPVRLSWGRLQFKVYWWLVDYILCTPWLGPILKAYLPLVGYILMFTLA